MALLPIAMLLQSRLDRRSRAAGSAAPAAHTAAAPASRRPSAVVLASLAIALGLNVFFWLPYVRYLLKLPAETLANRPVVHTWVIFTVPLLRKVAQQVAPIDLFYFFEPDRNMFLSSIVRGPLVAVSLGLGVPLLAYGLWQWLRSPHRLPVLGLWWWVIIAAFTVARIHCYPFYVLALAPITAVLPAGVFDGPLPRVWARRLMAWRWAYVASLLTLTLVAGGWIAGRGGSRGDYGVTYAIREAQARAAVALDKGGGWASVQLHEAEPQDPVWLSCGLTPVEVQWLARWADPQHRDLRPSIRVCDDWVGPDRVYRWRLRDEAAVSGLPPGAQPPAAREGPARGEGPR